MATVTGITVEEAQRIEGETVVSGFVDGLTGDLILTKGNGEIINAGSISSFTQALLDAHEGDFTTHGATGAVVGTTNPQTMSNKTLESPTLVTPIIVSFVNAPHDHDEAVSGGLINLGAQGVTGRSKMHFGSAFVTPGPGGKAVIAHGAGFTPDQVIATVADTDAIISARAGIVCNVVNDEIGGTNFSVRLYRNDNATSHENGTRINFICMKA